MSDDNTVLHAQLKRFFYLHRNIFIVVIAVLFVINWWLIDLAWFFWLTLIWSVLFGLHFCFVKSLSVDEDWAYDRAFDLRIKSYDYKHIHSIRAHYIKPKKSAAKASEKND